MRAFLDTNILLDLYAQREGFFESARTLCVAKAFGDVELWACTQSFEDSLYILRHAISSEDLRRQVKESLRYLSVVSSDPKNLITALGAGWEDVEDCLIFLCAKRTGADCVITRDKPHFSRADIPIYTPDEFLGLLQEAYGVSYEMTGF